MYVLTYNNLYKMFVEEEEADEPEEGSDHEFSG